MLDPIIQISNLVIGYGNRCVISDVNADIYAGDFIGIVGCNGAGKSTLMKTLRGLLPMQQGSIKYANKELAEYKDKELAKMVAYLQQNVEVGFGYTGQEIVLAGRYPYMRWWQSENEEDKQLALDCMDYTGTRDLADKPVTEVSGGQKQRILLAKVLAQQTPILFLDEPTTGLDMVYQEEIFRFAKELAKMGKTILMVVHELNLAAKYCNRIILVGEKRILADAAPYKAFTPELLSRAYATEILVNKNPLTGNIEITSKINPDICRKEAQLLQKICCNT